MSKIISLKKLNEKVKKSKSGGLVVGLSQDKGVVIGEKRPREDPSSSPSKKDKVTDNPKGKETASAIQQTLILLLYLNIPTDVNIPTNGNILTDGANLLW